MDKLFRKIFPPSGYRSPLLSYPVLLALTLAELWYILHSHFGETVGGDAWSYFDAMDTLTEGRVDVYRTPVYPAVLLALELLSGPHRLVEALQLANCAFTIVGAWYFMRAADKFTFGRPRAVFWLTAVYCLNPWWHKWAMYVYTEPMALMGMSMFLYWTVRDLPRRCGVVAAVMSGLWLVISVFLRPIMICIVPGVIVFRLWIRRRSGGRSAAAGLAGAGLCVVLVAVYVAGFGRTHGVYRMTAVSAWNDYWFLSEAGFIHPEYTDNRELKEFVTTVNAGADTISTDPFMLFTWGAPLVTEETPLTDIDWLIKRGFHENRAGIPAALLARMRLRVLDEPLLSYIEDLKIITEVLGWKMGLLIVFQAGSLLWLLWLWRGGVRPPGAWLCWYIMTAVSWTSYIGAYYQWARLILPACPAILLLVWQMLSFTRPAPRRALP